MSIRSLLAPILLGVSVSAIPLGALAQGSYGETIRGTILSVDGAGNLELRDDRGFVDNVRLEPNVDVTPAGAQLARGMRVTISGANAGSVFAAERVAAVDAPPPAPQSATPSYAYPAPYPVYAYPYPVYAYPYPVYAYPYPAGPRVSIGIGFGFGSGYHGRFRH
jgi:hypothetical protein